ncbi:MAG: chorismate-binding protein, partial [Proteobacteria bacterium]|nr:chorismate-binding protein [Pseudomonadota bacterium]
MKIFPDFKDFADGYGAGRPGVVWTTLLADLETPVSAMLKLAGGQPNSFLLESVEGGSIRGRYSFIGLRPDLIWRCFGDRAEINRRAQDDAGAFQPCPVGAEAGTIASLRALVAESRIGLPPGLPPMAAGLVGYMSYDVVRLVEHLPDANPDVLGTPDGIFLRPTVMAVFDSIEDVVTVITPVWPQRGLAAVDAYDQARDRLAGVLGDFQRPPPYRAEAGAPSAASPEPRSNMERRDFHRMVEKAKEYILAGDIFQVVLSQRFSVPFSLPPFSLYRALRRLNPSPFLYFLDFGDFSVVGSSPEIL